nr:methyltransferase domain-containing protein [Prochlorococcus marinus]
MKNKIKKIKRSSKKNNVDIFSFTKFTRTLKDVYKISIMRSLMNQLIEKIYFKGRIVDIGGGKNSNYSCIIRCDNYTSINIDKKINPDILVDINEKFPLEDDQFDQCLLFNVLEHVYDWDFLFAEIKRVLKNDSFIHIIIPFIYPIHGSPNDYIRVTSDYIKNFLRKNSFKNITTSPISYGPFTNSQLIGYRHKIINGPCSQFAVILDKAFHKCFKEKYFRYNTTNPLFYYVKANLKK